MFGNKFKKLLNTSHIVEKKQSQNTSIKHRTPSKTRKRQHYTTYTDKHNSKHMRSISERLAKNVGETAGDFFSLVYVTSPQYPMRLLKLSIQAYLFGRTIIGDGVASALVFASRGSTAASCSNSCGWCDSLPCRQHVRSLRLEPYEECVLHVST